MLAKTLMFDGNFQKGPERHQVQFHQKVESKDTHSDCERSSFISNTEISLFVLSCQEIFCPLVCLLFVSINRKEKGREE